MAAWVSVYTAACMSIGTPDRGPLLHPTWCNAKHKPRVSPPPRPSCGTSPEGQHGQGAVGLVAGVTAQPAAPEVMMPQVPQRRLCAEVLRATQQTAGSGLCPPPGRKPSLPHVSHQSWVQPQAPSHPAPARSPRGSTVPCSARSPSDLSHTMRAPPLPGPSRRPTGTPQLGVLWPLSCTPLARLPDAGSAPGLWSPNGPCCHLPQDGSVPGWSLLSSPELSSSRSSYFSHWATTFRN